MYNVSELEELYTDVFPCYKLGDRFPLEDAVMFRFPLRCEAETSDISHSVVTIEELDDLMDDFKTELFEVLLFVNNVKEISLWEIDEKSGIPKERYKVKANLKPEEETKRQEFGAYTRNVTRQLKKEGKQISEIQMKEVTYVMNLEDSCGHKEEWLVAQRLGFEENVEIPQSVLTAYQRKDLGLLPRGGVATLLSSAGGAVTRPMKAYCFLPLPLSTNLPVNINGHFALDHEARRSLWRDEGEGFRGDWNNLLLHDVVAACYVTLLDEVRNFLHLGPNEDHVTRLNCTRLDIHSRLERLRKLLPGVEVAVEDPYWVTLTESVYKYVDKHQVRILPVVRDLEANPNVSKSQESGVSVYWLSPTGKDKDEAFFADLQNFPSPPSNPANDNPKKEQSRQQMREVFQHVLLTTGFNLVEFPLSVFHALVKSGIKASCISPSSVIEFYKSFSRKIPLCNVGQIPAQLSFTPFENDLSLMLVLQYCKRDPDFMKKLDGLPLLLTKDNKLSAYSCESPVFLSKFYDLLPECAGMFVHPTIYRNVFESGSLSHDPEFKVFDVAEFARLLRNTLSKEKYHARNTFSEWSPNEESVVPNQKWLHKVWKFLSAEVSTMLTNKRKEKAQQDQAGGGATQKEKLSKEDEMQETRALLAPLKEWNILPATETAGKPNTKTSHLLFPLKLETSVVDMSSCDLPSFSLRDAFRKSSLPELNWQVLQSSTYRYIDRKSRLPPRCFVATLDNPVAMLEAMKEKMSRSSLHGKLEHKEAKLILEYFSNNTERLQQSEHIEVLKRLPFHETIHGNMIKITGQSVFVLPTGIPRHGVDVVEKASGVVFLKDSFSLKELHKLLHCKPSSEVDVYCDVVFLHFSMLTEGDRYAHLDFIRSKLLPRLQLAKDMKGSQKLTSSLSKLEFLPKPRSNCSGKASSYYDPSHDVFKVMLPVNLFPPKPFNSPEWLSFLRIIGLIKDVTSSKFVEFAKQVATEAHVLRNDNTRRKSKTLISHLFSRPNVINDDYFLEQVSTIPFIASEHVDQALQSLHSQHGETTGGHLPYTAFKNAVAYEKYKLVWTTAHLLPSWANPRSHIHNFQIGTDCRANYSLDQYCDSIIKHLKITERPCLQQVLQHCRNLCTKLVSENDMSEEFKEKRFKDKTSVMSSLYKFFQSNIFYNDEGVQARRALQHTPCILVESGKRFVYPNQVVIEFLGTQEIKPYLYAAPHKFGKFRNIFEQIGCPRTVGCNEYAMVLRLLQRLWPEDMVANPNSVTQILHAVKGFFECLEKDEPKAKPMSFESLYLPCYTRQRSNDPGLPQDETLPLYLRQGQSLIYDDAPRYKERLGQFSEMFLVDLKVCGIKKVNLKDDLLTKVPKEHRPKLLSDVVKEELVAEESGSAVPLGEASSLQQKLTSQEFCRGVVRLIRHENSHNATLVDENIVHTIERKLRNIKFYGLEKVVTHLIHRGHVIPGSEEVVPHHQTQEIQGDEVIWKIYLSKRLANSEKTDSILSQAITSAIIEIASGQLGESSATIPLLLNTPVHEMWSLLDHLGIRQDDSYDPSLNSPLPEPGSFIPSKDHHLLDNKFQEFDVGDYVGFETCDASLPDEEATFIYAIIMEKIQESCGDIPSFMRKYKINIGRNREPVIVSAEKLYKFHRVLPASPEGIVLFVDEENQSMAQKQKTKSEIFKEITRILEDAWRQPEEVRRRVVKRLYLRWHPDKNLGNEEFCKEVCHYIESEIARLSRPNSNSSYYGGCYTGCYGGLFAYWGTRASRHRRCRDQYRVSFNRRYPRGPRSHFSTFSSCTYTSRYVPPSFSTSNPQPQEARRWLRQAEMDLESVTNDERSATVFYEWACFKCHQAAEKALKAAHYMVDADKTDTHDLIQNANRLDDPELRNVATRLGNLLGNSDHMRYPDTMRSHRIPHEVYTEEMAAEGLELAQRIVAKVAVIVRSGIETP